MVLVSGDVEGWRLAVVLVLTLSLLATAWSILRTRRPSLVDPQQFIDVCYPHTARATDHQGSVVSLTTRRQTARYQQIAAKHDPRRI
jgi:hypothetical protein